MRKDNMKCCKINVERSETEKYKKKKMNKFNNY